jgi:hypothetical protein
MLVFYTIRHNCNSSFGIIYNDEESSLKNSAKTEDGQQLDFEWNDQQLKVHTDQNTFYLILSAERTMSSSLLI